jgi:hypothetical protein
LEKKARVIEEASLAYGQLQAKPSRTPDEDAQLKSLGATIQQEGSDIQSVLTNKIFPELDAQSAPGQASGTPQRVSFRIRFPNSVRA